MQHDFAQVDDILGRHPRAESSLVMVLREVQAHYRYLPCEALEKVADALGLPHSDVFSFATLHGAFRLEPQGRAVVQVCRGTACRVQGAELIEGELVRRLGVQSGETTPDGAVTLRTVDCAGACTAAPVVMVGCDVLGGNRPDRVDRVLRRAQELTAEPLAPSTPAVGGQRLASPEALLVEAARLAGVWSSIAGHVRVCGGPSCSAAGAGEVERAIKAAAASAGVPLAVELGPCPHGDRLLTRTGCQGACHHAALVHVMPGDVLYARVKPSDAPAIVDAMAEGGVVERLLSADGRGRAQQPFFRGQSRVALRVCGDVPPESLEAYMAAGGFRAFAAALLGRAPVSAAEGLRRAGLDALTAEDSASRPRRVVATCDDGAGGALAARAILEGAPFQVLEGLLLGAYAVGAREGCVQVRDETPSTGVGLGRAVEALRRAGLLGERILGTDFCFDVRVSSTADALARGAPAVLVGGLGDPSDVLGSVERWARLAAVAAGVPEGLAANGTKVVELLGQVRRKGLVEVPASTSVRDVVFTIGGGVPEGRSLKAVHVGGPFGVFLPENKLGLSFDSDVLAPARAAPGGSQLLVLDDRACVVDVARGLLDVLEAGSRGVCPTCQRELPRLSRLMRQVSLGEATLADLASIEGVCRAMNDGCRCGFRGRATASVRSALHEFRGELEAHVAGHCPAGVCRGLTRLRITDACSGCLVCLRACPEGAIRGERKQVHVIDDEKCTRCGVCRAVCNFDAVVAVPGGVGATNRCLLCGLCEQVCGAVATNAVRVSGQGSARLFAPSPERCVGCDACAMACPTGHIETRRTPAAHEVWGLGFATDPCVVDEARCSGCGMCEELCPFSVARVGLLGNGERIARIPAEHCRGCGVCVGACPNGAIDQRTYSWRELTAEPRTAEEVAK